MFETNPRKRRRRSRNAKRGSRRLAALRGWRRRKHRNPSFAFNGRRRRRHRSNRWGYNRRRRGFNPSAIASKGFGAVTAGFKPAALMSAGMVVGGTISNAFVRGFLKPMLPAMLQTGVPGAAVGLATAGAVGALARMFAPNQAGMIFTGAMSEAVLNAMKELLPSNLKAQIGLTDYLTQEQVTAARRLEGLNDYLTQQQVSSARQLQGLGDDNMGCGLDLMEEIQDF